VYISIVTGLGPHHSAIYIHSQPRLGLGFPFQLGTRVSFSLFPSLPPIAVGLLPLPAGRPQPGHRPPSAVPSPTGRPSHGTTPPSPAAHDSSLLGSATRLPGGPPPFPTRGLFDFSGPSARRQVCTSVPLPSASRLHFSASPHGRHHQARSRCRRAQLAACRCCSIS
jgi:hypothetical protein